MDRESFDRAKAFYKAVIECFRDRYPRFSENHVGMLKVLHAFDDKIPLIEALLEEDLLTGVVLKKSSSEAQRKIARSIEARLREHDLLMTRSETTYAGALPSLSRRTKNRPFIIGDHGGYYAHALPHIESAFAGKILGMTEHTLNGERKIHTPHTIPYFSTAHIDLKERSDREIAKAIARQIVITAERLGKSMLRGSEHVTVLLIGYGLMGLHASKELKSLGCPVDILVTDTSSKKLAFAVQDGHVIVKDMDAVLPYADVIILATDVVRGRDPVLYPSHFAVLKEDVCITSMTSLDDEAAQSDLIRTRIIEKIGHEGTEGVYRGPTGTRFFLMQDGRPANVALTNGGADESIYMVEAAGLAGGFIAGHYGAGYTDSWRQANPRLTDEDADIISALWLEHFHADAFRNEDDDDASSQIAAAE